MDKAKSWDTEPERDWFIGAREAGGDTKINGDRLLSISDTTD